MEEFDKEIWTLKNAWLEAVKENKDQKTIDKLVNQGHHCAFKFVDKLVSYCLERNDLKLPSHMEISPDLWRDGFTMLLKGFETKGQEFPAEKIQNAREAGMNYHYDNTIGEDIVSMKDGTKQRQCTVNGRKTYWVDCGPLRCGERGTDDKCPHGVIMLLEKPEGWKDGVGWQDGKNYFQIANQSLWATPRFQWDAEGNGFGPRDELPRDWKV